MAGDNIVIDGKSYKVFDNSYYKGYAVKSSEEASNAYLAPGGSNVGQGVAGSGAFLRLGSGINAKNIIADMYTNINVGNGGTRATLDGVLVHNLAFVQTNSTTASISNAKVMSGGTISLQPGSTIKDSVFDYGSNLTVRIDMNKPSMYPPFENITLNKGTSINIIDNSRSDNVEIRGYVSDYSGQNALYIEAKSGDRMNVITINLNKNSSVDSTTGFRNDAKMADPWTEQYWESTNRGGAPNYTGFRTCFLKGSLIKTPSSHKEIEKFQDGDEISTFVGDEQQTESVIWVGEATCTVDTSLSDEFAGYPVRLMKNSISDGVPFEDLLLTPEHCLYFEGKFVPVRMLVNKHSIFYDKSITSYEYYHVETKKHSIISSNGLLTESYLDTGNRDTFYEGNAQENLIKSRSLSWDNAAAPLDTSRSFVEPLYNNFLARAELLGFTKKVADEELTNNPNLYLLSEAGVKIPIYRKNKKQVMFMIPSGVKSVEIVSNVGVPSEIFGPYIDDRRSLGVLVGSIALFNAGEMQNITTHLTTEELSGWHEREDPTMRWTSGKAELPLSVPPLDEERMLSIEIISSGPYFKKPNVVEFYVR